MHQVHFTPRLLFFFDKRKESKQLKTKLTRFREREKFIYYVTTGVMLIIVCLEFNSDRTKTGVRFAARVRRSFCGLSEETRNSREHVRSATILVLKTHH